MRISARSFTASAVALALSLAIPVAAADSAANAATTSASAISTAGQPSLNSGLSPHMHDAGQKCVTISSQNNWKATICAITNADDQTAEQSSQALITYTIKSGSLSEIEASGIWIWACLTSCLRQHPIYSTYKLLNGGTTSFLSNPFTSDFNDTVQAVVNKPCVFWTNGQVACYNGSIRDKTISTH